jgi:hypothetical protein
MLQRLNQFYDPPMVRELLKHGVAIPAGAQSADGRNHQPGRAERPHRYKSGIRLGPFAFERNNSANAMLRWATKGATRSASDDQPTGRARRRGRIPAANERSGNNRRRRLRVVEAANADEAIAIREARPDTHVVFTDIQMPGCMDGLTRQLRQGALATDQDRRHLRLPPRRERRSAERQPFRCQTLPAGANRRRPSRADRRRISPPATYCRGTTHRQPGPGLP